MSWDDRIDFASLLGKTLVKIDVAQDRETVRFHTATEQFWMGHHQDCCESVSLEEVAGDLTDLIGAPILLAEEVVSNATPDGYQHYYEPESQTWTFYKLATVKGHVTLRWFGSSNGYYSEGVDFEQAPA